ncbi:hypothetical protein GCM10020219_037120 [Nonomuraea dietziae]
MLSPAETAHGTVEPGGALTASGTSTTTVAFPPGTTARPATATPSPRTTTSALALALLGGDAQHLMGLCLRPHEQVGRLG